ncbi:hypothetical protein GCM10023200_01040 [Actinomycetospora chlora]|uniref:LppX_LprAFG lipoprotein n=1 Tax=Actinomycetospora chlora TaxID=663608 RepID=A0ABP9A256_9PSEU
MAVLLALAALLAGACGRAAPPDPLTAVRGAVAQTFADRTAQIAFTSRTGPPGTPGTEVTGTGVTDLVARSADVAVQAPLLGGGTRVLLVGGTLDVAVPPALAALVPGGRPWVSVPLDRLTAATLGGALPQFGGTPADPLSGVGALQGITEARLVGPEPVDGTPATRYATTVDLLATPAASDPAQRPAIDRLVAQIGSSRLPVDVWVGDDGRVRRVAQTVTAPDRPGRPATATAVTVTLSGHGLPVTIAPPPADQVTDVSALLPAG